MFEAVYSDRTRWVLDHVDPSDYQLLRRCIMVLERDPFPPPALLGPLVIPGRTVYAQAYRCRAWRIAFHVEDDVFVVVDDVGQWPPRAAPT